MKLTLTFFHAQSQECKVKMTVESLAMKTVKLLADQVKDLIIRLPDNCSNSADYHWECLNEPLMMWN